MTTDDTKTSSSTDNLGAVGSQVDRGVRPLAWMPVLGFPIAIRAALLDRRQAEINHGQTLERLAERGGLSLSEAAAVALRRKWEPMSADAALAALKSAAERYVPGA